MNRTIRSIAVALCLGMLASPAAAQAPKATITGAGPFSFGMTAAQALAADPGLTQSATTSCGTTAAPGTRYWGRAVAPLAGYPYTANVMLCFLGDQLGAIYLSWPQGTFQG